MKLPLEVCCLKCSKIFCCKNCRQLHNQTVCHVEIIEAGLKCDICKYGVIFPRKFADIAEFICNHHFPLVCKKCSNIFANINDFTGDSTCKGQCPELEMASSTNKRENAKQIITISSLLSVEEIRNNLKKKDQEIILTSEKATNESLTPISKWNIKWKTKSQGLTDSISFIPNVSSITNSANNNSNKISPKVRIARSTSTPMQELLYVIKQSGFHSLDGSSSCQMSSIRNVNNSDSDTSPPVPGYGITPMAPKIEKNKYQHQFMNKGRNKLPLSATPLRQVMSKSIQKAITQRDMKQLFEMNDKSVTNSPASQPLDLRTTPVLRRYNSDSGVLTKSNRKTCKSIQTSSFLDTKPESTLETTNSIYETCKNIDDSEQSEHVSINSSQENFKEVSPAKTCKDDNSESEEIWYTPSAVIPRNEQWKTAAKTKKMDGDLSRGKTKKLKRSRFWSVITSVFRISSYECVKKTENIILGDNTGLFLSRSATFGGFPEFSDDRHSALKRRRTASVQSSDSQDEYNPIKRMRIHGRLPIQRMRKTIKLD